MISMYLSTFKIFDFERVDKFSWSPNEEVPFHLIQVISDCVDLNVHAYLNGQENEGKASLFVHFRGFIPGGAIAVHTWKISYQPAEYFDEQLHCKDVSSARWLKW